MSSLLQVRPWAQEPPLSESGQATRALEEDRLVEGLKHQQPWARAALVDRYGIHVRRVLVRVLGASDPEIDDLAQETFMAALQGAGGLQSAAALKAWLTSITIFTARGLIRRRQRWRWLRSSHDADTVAAPSASPDIADAARCVYKILEQMPADERIPFALRMFEGLELAELAQACDMTVATARRRLASAQSRFDKAAAQSEVLAPWQKKREAVHE